jgi:metal-sulfur cluster biosynthetic enzyme
MISTTNKVKKKNNDSILKTSACQYYGNISSQYSQKVSMILFVNKVKIKWEYDNCIERKKNMNIKK